MSNKIKGITIEIGGDTQKLTKALEGVNKQSRDLQGELKQVERLLKLDPKNTELLAQKQRLLSEAVENTKGKLETLREAERQVQQQFQEGKVGEEQYRAIQREVIKTEQQLQSLENQLKETNNTWKTAAENLEKFGKKATDIGKDMTKKVTAPIAALGGVAANSAVQFESAFAGVRKTIDATEEEFAELEKGIRNMAKEIPASATEIAAVAEAAGQLGIKTENILEFTRVMIDMGEATNLSAEEAASSLAKFANITQMSQKDFDKLGSTIVALGNNLATTEADIVAMGQRLAGAGAQIGLTEAQIMAFAGALSSVGIEAQAGGSAFSKVMVDMQLAVETNSDRLNEFAKVAGMSADEFRQAFQEDAAGAIISFIQGLSNAEGQGMSAIKILDDMGIKEVRLRDALLRAAGASNVFTDALNIGTKAWEENSALAAEAEQRYKTSESQLAILKNTLNDLAITFGEIIVPVILSLADKVKGLLEWINNLSPGIKNAIAVFAGLVAVIGPLLMIVGQMSLGLSSLIGLFGGATAATAGAAAAATGATAATGGLSAVIGALTGPIGIAIAAIAAIVAILVHLWKTNEEFRGNVKQIWEQIKEIFSVAMNFIKQIVTTIYEAIKNFWQQNSEQIKDITEAVWNTIANIVNSIMNIIKGILDVFIGIFTGDWERFGQGLTKIWEGLWNGIQAIIDGAKNIIQNIVQIFINLISSKWEGFGNFLQNIWDILWGTIETIIDSATQIIRGIFDAFIGLFTGDWERMTDGLKNIWQGMWDGIKAIVEGAWDYLSTAFGSLWDSISGWFTGLVEDAFGWGKNLIDGFIDGIKSMISKVKQAASSVTNAVSDFLGFHSPAKKGEGRHIVEWGYNMIDGFMDGMKKAMPELQISARAVMPVVKNEIINATQIDYSKIPKGDTTIYVNNPQPSPSELARQIKKTQQELALGF